MDAAERDRIVSTPVPRFVRNDGKPRDIEVRNRPKDGTADFYYRMMTLHWWQFSLGAIALYAGINLVFGLLYWLDPHGLVGARSGSLFDSVNFSVETLGTIGYGAISPRGWWANLLVATEAFLNIAVTALGTGLIFARVSRPTARVMFSERALITAMDGQRVFSFRAANQRDNQILEADVTVSLAMSRITQEGLAFRQLVDLPLVRQRQPLFALTWTVLHVIDEASPLWGATEESLRAARAELIVVMSGTDSTVAGRVHARHSYLPDEIAWDAYYEDVIYPEPNGRWVIDYDRFHRVRATPAPAPRSERTSP